MENSTDNSQLLTARHGLVVGVEGSGKSTFVRGLLKNNLHKNIYITTTNENFEGDICISINEPSDDVKDSVLKTIREMLEQERSFVIKIPYSFVGQMKGIEYVNEILHEILETNKDFLVVIDNVRSVAGGNHQNIYRELLAQKAFSVLSIISSVDEELDYIFDYVEKVYIFKISPTNFSVFERRGLLSENDIAVFDQGAGEFIVR